MEQEKSNMTFEEYKKSTDPVYDQILIDSLKAENAELKKISEQLKAEADLRDMDIDDLKEEIRRKADYLHKLEGKVEAYEFCIKNGRGK